MSAIMQTTGHASVTNEGPRRIHAATLRQREATEAVARREQKLNFPSHDNVALFYRYWPAPGGLDRHAIILVHDLHEHSGRMQHLPDELQLDQFAFFAFDGRGHGCSPGARGDSPSVACSVRDLDRFARHIAAHHHIPIERIAVIAQGTGAVLAATWMHDYAPRIRCAVLAAAAFKFKQAVPFARIALALRHKLQGNFHVGAHVPPQQLTHDPARVTAYERDPLVTHRVSVRTLAGIEQAANRIIRSAQSIRSPVQMLIAGKDRVVDVNRQREFFARLGSTDKECHTFKCFYHDMLGERGRHFALTRVRGFVAQMFEREPQHSTVDRASRSDTSNAASPARHAARPLRLRPRLAAIATRAALGTIGRLSSGLRLGAGTGFDSGSTQDYILRNVAHGVTPMGRFVDRLFLDSLGARVLRVRRSHLEQAIRTACRNLRAAAAPVRIVDIAAGHGRSVLDAVQSLTDLPDAVLLRDNRLTHVAEGIELIRERRLTGVVRFVQGDPYNTKALADLASRTTLAVAAGLYELCPDDTIVERSLAGLSQAVPQGGYLVYTGMAGQPRSLFAMTTLFGMQESLASGTPHRPQADLDQLVERAGFRKLDTWVDEHGMATVSLAIRV